jgi:hypothetical protein
MASNAAIASLPVVKRAHKGANFFQGQVYGLAFGHLGKLSMIAVYFILTQWLRGQHLVLGNLDVTLWNVKYVWDNLLSHDISHGGFLKVMTVSEWTYVRHVVRPFMEGLFAILLYMQIRADPDKYYRKIKPNPPLIDRVLRRIPLIPSRYKKVGVAQEIALPFIVLIVGTIVSIPFFLWILPFIHDKLHLLKPYAASHPSLLDKLYLSNSDAFIIGIVAGILIKRITKPVLVANMMWYCRRWVAKKRGTHWWMPEGMRYTVQALYEIDNPQERNREEMAAQEKWFGPAVAAVTALTFVLAIYGFYIINYIA